MRKLISLAAVLSLLCSNPALGQQLLIPKEPGAQQIGVAAAIRGEVKVASGAQVGQEAKSGRAIYLGDTITTGPNAGLQILLLDETIFTIGPNSSIVIDEFVYDPSTDAGQVSASVTKGVFRFVTGKVAHRNPEKMKVKMPTGTIGIRGTIGGGIVEEGSSKAILFGPGARANTGEPPGKLLFGNTPSNHVTIARPGYSSTIGSDGIPSSPILDPQAVNLVNDTLDMGESDGPGTDEGEAGDIDSATEEAGQEAAESYEDLGETESMSELSEDLEDASTESSTQAAAESTRIADGISTKEQLRTVETGQFHYYFGVSSGNTPGQDQFTQTTKLGSPVNIVGNVAGSINIDFGARTIGGGDSYFGADTTTNGGNISGEVAFPSHSFATGSDSATFSSTVSSRTGTFTVNNSNGVAGRTATFSVSYDDGSNAGSSNAITVTRAAGLTD